MNGPGSAPIGMPGSSHPRPPLDWTCFASFDRRVAGFVCDLVVLTLLWILASRLFSAVLPFPLAWWLTVLFGVIYVIGFTAIGVTPGSWVVGIRLVDRFGRAPGLLRSAGRSFLPPLIWCATAWVIATRYSPVQRIDYLVESDSASLAALLGLLTLAACAIGLIDVLKTEELGPRGAWHSERTGTFIIRAPKWRSLDERRTRNAANRKS